MAAKKRSQTGSESLTPRRRRQWVAISYDVTDDRRRSRVMKAIAGYGERVQYSVFECEMRPDEVDTLRQRLASVIDPKQDDVRFYLLCESCLGKVKLLGKAKRYERQSHRVV